MGEGDFSMPFWCDFREHDITSLAGDNQAAGGEQELSVTISSPLPLQLAHCYVFACKERLLEAVDKSIMQRRTAESVLHR